MVAELNITLEERVPREENTKRLDFVKMISRRIERLTYEQRASPPYESTARWAGPCQGSSRAVLLRCRSEQGSCSSSWFHWRLK